MAPAVANEFAAAGIYERKSNAMREIVIDGVVYVPKVETEKDYVMVRTQNAGVFAGRLVLKEGSEVELSDARRIWKWVGAASLSELAVRGTSNPEGCMFPVEVPKITLLQVIEIIPMTPAARKSIKEVPVWTRHTIDDGSGDG